MSEQITNWREAIRCLANKEMIVGEDKTEIDRIRHCVNCHDDLLEALKNAVSYVENMDYDFDHVFWGEIRDAIAKSEGKQQ